MEIKDCKSAKDYLVFFDNDTLAFRHTNYYHYTSLENANKILESKQLRLTQLSKTANDLLERKAYDGFDRNIFSVCFSTGTSESLPLWYLYSGIDGRGARIGLKKKHFIQMKEQLDISLLEVESQYPYKAIGSTIKLREEDYSFKCRDIIYIGQDPQKHDTYRIKYNGNAINGVSKTDFNEITNGYKGCTKGLIWFYEKETRMQIEILNHEIMNKNKNYVLTMSIDRVYNDISICLAPEFGDISTEIFDNYEALKSLPNTRLKKSDFAGQLEMNLTKKLCSACTRGREVSH